MDTATIDNTSVQLIVNIEDASMVNELRRTIRKLKGVTSTRIFTSRSKKTSYQKSREDIEAGRVYTYSSIDDFIKEIEA